MNLRNSFWSRTFIYIALFSAMCCLTSCKKKEEAPAPRPSSASPSAASPHGGSVAASQGVTAPHEKKRKVILNYSIYLEVQEFEKAVDSLIKLAESSGGHVLKNNSNSQDKSYKWAQVGIRVPSTKVGNALTTIRGLGTVERENSTAEDITEGYVDLEARIKNAKVAEARLLQLSQKAGKLADVLEIEKEISRVRGEIESFEAKKQNWDVLTEMVTIEVEVHEGSGSPSLHKLWTTLKATITSTVQGLFDSVAFLMIAVAAILPWAVVFGPLAYLFIRFRRKMLQKSSSTNSNDCNREPKTGADTLP
jgi:hypothetical protein